MEEFPSLSIVARVDWHSVGSYSHEQIAATDWSFGARFHSRRPGKHPYAEGCVGVRVVDGPYPSAHEVGAAAAAQPSPGAEANGVVLTMRLGLSTARPGRSGFMMDSGVAFLAHNPGSFAIVPVRLGVAFP
jgi:hypothetical protein